ncbi:hypothetical protein AURDEDRAFT_171435 [Auricularia subglabra TFB-10046 SS5]|nr:hypothetical protein AURDEDRAFT_171435 [Auricularia subglabra TFB-10046 SS5]
MNIRYDQASQAHLPRMRSECHALFDACAAVLFRPRLSQDFDKLRAQMERNVLACERPASCHIHPLFRSATAVDPLNALFDGVSQVMHAGLYQGNRPALGRAWMPHRTFGDKHGRWPSRVGQLFPYGEKATVDALLDVLDRDILFGPLGILNELLVISRTVVLPALLPDRNRGRVIRAVAKLLVPTQLREIARTMPWYAGGDRAMFPAAVGFLRVTFYGPGAVPGEAKELCSGNECRLLTAVIAGLENVKDEDYEMTILVYVAVDIYAHLGVLYPSKRFVVPERILNWAAAQRAKTQGSFSRILLQLVSQTVKRRRCAASDCRRSEHESGDGTSFSMCARCKVPRYCSKECQARDWKGVQSDADGSLPHKRVCPVLCKVDAINYFDLPIEEFDVRYADVARDFSPEDKLALNEFATVVGRDFGYIFGSDDLRTFPSVDLV